MVLLPLVVDAQDVEHMAVVHLEAPVLDPAVAVDVERLDGELGRLVLRLALEVGQQPGLQHEVAHVDEGAPDLAAAVSDHPPLVDHCRRGRRHLGDEGGARVPTGAAGRRAWGTSSGRGEGRLDGTGRSSGRGRRGHPDPEIRWRSGRGRAAGLRPAARRRGGGRVERAWPSPTRERPDLGRRREVAGGDRRQGESV